MASGPSRGTSPVSFTLPPGANGILPDRMIAAMADAGLIRPEYPFVESQIQPASLDLRLGDIAYRVRASFLPGPGATVAERIDRKSTRLYSSHANISYAVFCLKKKKITGAARRAQRTTGHAIRKARSS